MDPKISCTFWTGNCRVNFTFSLIMIAVLGAFSIGIGVVLGGCKSSDAAQVVKVAGVVQAPSTAASMTIRTKVAALTKKQVAAHPAMAGWANELAKVCFQLSGVTVPKPDTLRQYFALASYFVPSTYAAGYASLSGEVADTYAADYGAAVAVQTAGTPYLTLVGQGIQDGVKAAAVGEAP